MTTFLDGPAEGKRLALQRAPVFLRAVIDQDGAVDALDLLEDEPKGTETVYVYYRDPGSLSRAFVCSRGHPCRLMESAEYRLYDPQPPGATARDNEAWADWTRREYEQMMHNTVEDAANRAFDEQTTIGDSDP